MSVGGFGRGYERSVPGPDRGSARPDADVRRGLTSAQVEALKLSIGAHVSFAGSCDDPSVKATFVEAAVTLQGMLDADTRTKAR